MPKRIFIIGTIFCLGGLLAIWDMVDKLYHSQISINFSVFLLPVGIGLLRGKKSSRGWAKFWIILGYAVCGLILILVFLLPGKANFHYFDTQIQGSLTLVYTALIVIPFLSLLIAAHKLLYSQKANTYFDYKNNLPRH